MLYRIGIRICVYLLCGDRETHFDIALFHVPGGVDGAFFMATDYVTTPLLPMGSSIRNRMLE